MLIFAFQIVVLWRLNLQANVLEYYYQFNLASKQEQQLQELAYTTVVTAISTAISMGVSFGIGKVVGLANKYLGSLVNLPDLSGITGIQSVSKGQQFLHEFSTYLMQASVSLSGFAIVTACLKEISQEIFIDPLVETLVANLVREMGYDFTIQMIASTLAESFREEFSGQISSMFRGDQSSSTFQTYMDKRLTSEHQYPIAQELIQYFNEYKAELVASRDKKYHSRFLGVLGTSLKLFATAISAYSIRVATSKIADIVRNNKRTIITAIWVGTNLFGMAALHALLPPLAPFGDIGFGALTIGMVSRENLDNEHFSPLTGKQIKRNEQLNHRKLEKLCVKYALDFKNIIVEEYGNKILDVGIPLSSHFDFRLDKYIRKVTHLKRDRAVGTGILERVRLHIVQKYSTLERDAAKETSFKKVIDFIREYKEFSLHVSGKSGQGKFSISHIKYQQDSEELAPKAWLIENLRYMFPKKYGLPISDNLLSWFIYGDTPSYGRVTKIKWTMDNKELFKRTHIADLLAIDYRVNKLTKKSFTDKGIEISSKNLENLKKSVSYLVFYYIFGGYHDSTYVSETTSKGLPVGKNFFIIEYEVIRAIFFAATEANNGVPVNFEVISSVAGVSDLKHHLYEGYGFGGDLERIFSYFKKLSKNRPLDSSSQIFRDAEEVLGGYLDVYRARRNAFQSSREYASTFQGIVHKAMEDFFGVKFVSEEQVRSVVKDAYIDTINDDGVKEKIYVHGAFAFDLYLDLNKDLKDYLGLDDKWKGLAIEAMGTYWHSLPRQKEADRKKRLICKERNIILLEIPEALDRTKWCAEVLKQFKEKTGIEIPPNKLNNLYKYLGNI